MVLGKKADFVAVSTEKRPSMHFCVSTRQRNFHFARVKALCRAPGLDSLYQESKGWGCSKERGRMEERSDDGASRRPAGPCLLPQAKDGKANRPQGCMRGQRPCIDGRGRSGAKRNGVPRECLSFRRRWDLVVSQVPKNWPACDARMHRRPICVAG